MTTAQFIALAERISGQDLGEFFDAWLFTAGYPADAIAAAQQGAPSAARADPAAAARPLHRRPKPDTARNQAFVTTRCGDRWGRAE